MSLIYTGAARSLTQQTYNNILSRPQLICRARKHDLIISLSSHSLPLPPLDLVTIRPIDIVMSEILCTVAFIPYLHVIGWKVWLILEQDLDD